jgi:hypothetical protein
MSDFVDNLIAKSLGLTEVVAPRPTSLFEPLSSDAGPLAPEYYALEQDGAPQRTPASVEATMDGVAPPAPKDESSEITPPALRGAQSDLPPQHPVQVVDRSASLPAPPIPHQPGPPALAAGDADKRADRSEYVGPADQQTVDRHPAAPERAPLRIVLPVRTPANRQSTTAQEAALLIPPHEATGQAMAPVESMASTPSHTLLISSSPDQGRGSQSSDRAAALPSAPESEAPAAPTIKITIGRVDVRAMMPDKEAPRPAPAARNTALSLDEYLKRRSGGKP